MHQESITYSNSERQIELCNETIKDRERTIYELRQELLSLAVDIFYKEEFKIALEDKIRDNLSTELHNEIIVIKDKLTVLVTRQQMMMFSLNKLKSDLIELRIERLNLIKFSNNKKRKLQDSYL
jgi:hypothetical protein